MELDEKNQDFFTCWNLAHWNRENREIELLGIFQIANKFQVFTSFDFSNPTFSAIFPREKITSCKV